MRTGWAKSDRWLLFDCAPWGGAHSHQDQLQVLLYSGRALLMDSGQIVYDNPLSKSYFKTATAHNVLLVDGNGPSKSGECDPKVVTWCVKDSVEFAAGKVTHDGVTHQRSVLFVKPDYWVVVDHVNGTGSPTLTRLYHLPEGDVKQDGCTVRTTFSDGDNLWMGAADASTVEMREGLLAGGKSGRKVPVAAFVNKLNLPAALCTVLVPFSSEEDIPVIDRIHDGVAEGTVVIRVSFKDGRTDWIAVASKEEDLELEDQKGRGLALYVRSGAGKSAVETIKTTPLKGVEK